MYKLIYLPYKYVPYPYQIDVFQQILHNDIKRACLVWHRRAGKDLSMFNLCIAYSQIRVGTIFYVFPELTQARKAIWNGMDEDGNKFLSYIPDEILDRPPVNSDMRIHFKNGSIIQFVSANKYDNLTSTNPVMVIMNEYSIQTPLAWHFLSPVLAKNGGIAIFNYTPRGHNHGYKLYQTNKNNPDWFCQMLTADETKRHDGSPVYPPEAIEAERRAGQSEEMIQQEYYCSWEAATPGAYFAKELTRADKDGRLTRFSIDTSLPINTYWDIGYNDATTIWLIQKRKNDYVAVHYYENNQEGLQHYITYLDKFRQRHAIVYGEHFAPHDANHKNFQTGVSTIQMAAKLGFKFKLVPRTISKIDTINRAREYINRTTFDIDRCEIGLECLKQYHAKFNETMLVTSDSPCHDWSSHGADSFQTFAQAEDIYGNSGGFKVFANTVNSSPIW